MAYYIGDMQITIYWYNIWLVILIIVSNIIVTVYKIITMINMVYNITYLY